jgi:hypothetical protein
VCITCAKRFNNRNTACVHEPGHVFGLGEAFDEGDKEHDPYNIPRGTSRNFMDYSLVTDMFWKWQWDELRNNIVELVAEEENVNEQQ